MEQYFLTEEFRVYQRNPYIPLYIVGYGKGEGEDMLDYIYSIKYSPFADIRIKGFKNKSDYHNYIKEMQKRGVRVNYDNKRVQAVLYKAI